MSLSINLSHLNAFSFLPVSVTGLHLKMQEVAEIVEAQAKGARQGSALGVLGEQEAEAAGATAGPTLLSSSLSPALRGSNIFRVFLPM